MLYLPNCVQLSKSFQAARRLASHYSNTAVDTVQLAFLAQKLTSKSAHEPGTQSMGDNDIHYHANCAWVQHYPVTLILCPCFTHYDGLHVLLFSTVCCFVHFLPSLNMSLCPSPFPTPFSSVGTFQKVGGQVLCSIY